MKKIILLAVCVLATSTTIANDEVVQNPRPTPTPKPTPCMVAECPEVFVPNPKERQIPNVQFTIPELENIEQSIDMQGIHQRIF